MISHILLTNVEISEVHDAVDAKAVFRVVKDVSKSFIRDSNLSARPGRSSRRVCKPKLNNPHPIIVATKSSIWNQYDWLKKR